ncbi:MAG: hypothetical protein IKV85_04400 [Ruminococcus sp.]|nr:hypothetical protein [Ruminococcus sp.]
MDASQYKCPNCDAELIFDPATQQLNCEFCRSMFTMDKIKEVYADVKPESAEETEQKEEFESHTNLYQCKNCGAEIMAEDDTTATFCYYCHSPVILSGRLNGDFKPSKIIGFHIEREQAEKLFKDWCEKKKFIPADFKSTQQLEKMTGLYVPFWVTDCDVNADYQALGKKVRSWSSGSYRYTETKEYMVFRKAKIKAEGVPADGESKIEDLLMESIEPFDYTALKPFDMSYFSGFFADKYDVDKAAVFPRIKDRVNQASRNVINQSVIGYSSTVVQHQRYDIERTKWQYIMLPVWFMTYRYNDKIYEFAINGQTGKLAGTPPLDKAKLAVTSALFGLGAAVIAFLGGQFFI